MVTRSGSAAATYVSRRKAYSVNRVRRIDTAQKMHIRYMFLNDGAFKPAERFASSRFGCRRSEHARTENRQDQSCKDKYASKDCGGVKWLAQKQNP